ncbi:MAG: hypothetical protein FWC13_06765 [Oscillospiraceae bacterium]|nr:hypothetical protein [Oscillospiraceae bacterium]
MTTRSKSTLFLIEQLIVVAVFAICAVACISILTSAFFFAMDSSDTSRALIQAESSAEVFKATGGDLQRIAELTGGTVSFDDSNRPILTVFYDRQWQVVSYEQTGGFVLHIVSKPGGLAAGSESGIPQSLSLGELSVSRAAGDSLVSFPLAARVQS